MRSANYSVKKSKEISKAVRKNLFGMDPDDADKVEAFDEIMIQLKEKFNLPTTSRSDQLKVLSVLPKSWSVNKIVSEFNTSHHTVKQMKTLVRAQGILCTTESRSGHGITDGDRQKVVEFYDSDDISRSMPGTNDYVSEIRNGKKEHIQKRLIMMSLKEAYMIFEEKCKGVKVGFTSFTQLRPKHCILLDSTGTHNVCVCTIHENIKLMINSVKFDSQDEIIDKILCSVPIRTTDCFLRTCKKCISTEDIDRELTSVLEASDKEHAVFQQWLTTDRCNLETIIKPVDEFVPYFVEKIDRLITHDFIYKKQSSFLRNKKDSLKQGEILAICDFSENYSFIIQNAAQGYHWNNAQATIHPFEVYYRKDNKLENISFIIISEVLTHDSIAVQLFISKLLDFIKKKIDFSKIIFMSDGAAAHYKNKKNFASLCNFKSKYGLEAEWHFFATSHGKGPCDAIGGTLKRMAKRASLAQDYGNTIKTPRELYDWAVEQTYKSITKLNFCFISAEQYTKMSDELEHLYNHVKTIPGTQKLHCFIPISDNQILAKRFSDSNENPKKYTLYEKDL